MGELYTQISVEKKIKHYSSSHKILLVGEGDFSFSACLARTFGSASNMVATSLDSEGIVNLALSYEILLSKYCKVTSNLKELEDLGCSIIHEVDASKMSQHPLLLFKSFDRIVFNFPHAGFLYKEHDSYQIELHKQVVRGFLRNAKEMLTTNGEIHITHKTAHPFSKWEIEKLGEEEGLNLFEKAMFDKWEYTGYENKKGNGLWSDHSFPVGQCSTFKFTRPPNLGLLFY